MSHLPNHIVVTSLPKSGTMFVNASLVETLQYQNFTITVRGPVPNETIDPVALFQFVTASNAITQTHLAATSENLFMLKKFALRKMVLLVRDPRDALVSFYWNMERPGVINLQWPQFILMASGMISENYYSLTKEQKIDQLIERYYVACQEWLHNWIKILQLDKEMDILLLRYEDMAKDNKGIIAKLLQYYDLHNIEIKLAVHAEKEESGVSPNTHFRRGIVGSHLDELSERQIARITELSDPSLFRFCGWQLQ